MKWLSEDTDFAETGEFTASFICCELSSPSCGDKILFGSGFLSGDVDAQAVDFLFAALQIGQQLTSHGFGFREMIGEALPIFLGFGKATVRHLHLLRLSAFSRVREFGRDGFEISASRTSRELSSRISSASDIHPTKRRNSEKWGPKLTHRRIR